MDEGGFMMAQAEYKILNIRVIKIKRKNSLVRILNLFLGSAVMADFFDQPLIFIVN